MIDSIADGLIRFDGRNEPTEANLYGRRGSALDIKVGLGESKKNLDDVARARSSPLTTSSSTCSTSQKLEETVCSSTSSSTPVGE